MREGGPDMIDYIFGPLLQIGIDAFPISTAGWLGIWLLVWSVERAEPSRNFGGPLTFIFIWGVTVFATYQSQGRASPVLQTLYFSILALGLIAAFVHSLSAIFGNQHHPH